MHRHLRLSSRSAAAIAGAITALGLLFLASAEQGKGPDLPPPAHPVDEAALRATVAALKAGDAALMESLLAPYNSGERDYRALPITILDDYAVTPQSLADLAAESTTITVGTIASVRFVEHATVITLRDSTLISGQELSDSEAIVTFGGVREREPGVVSFQLLPYTNRLSAGDRLLIFITRNAVNGSAEQTGLQGVLPLDASMVSDSDAARSLGLAGIPLAEAVERIRREAR